MDQGQLLPLLVSKSIIIMANVFITSILVSIRLRGDSRSEDNIDSHLLITQGIKYTHFSLNLAAKLLANGMSNST